MEVLTKIAARLKEWRPSDVALMALFGGLLVWSLVSNYVGLFGLPGLSAADAATPIYLLGVVVLCLVPTAIVLAFFVLPRWDMSYVGRQEKGRIALLRAGVVALACCFQNMMIAVPLVLIGLFVAAASNAANWTGREGRARILEMASLMAAQIPAFLLTIVWFALWASVWMQIAAFWFPAALQGFAPFILIAISASGLIAYIAIRSVGWQPAAAILSVLLFALGLSNPGYAGVMAGALYTLNMGGGRMDLDASHQGPVLCDMGAFGHHFYIRAPTEGCSYEGATRWIGKLRKTEGPSRVKLLRESRVVVPAPAK